eukprot:GHVH01001374.1.p1 GENE.GHVH01001374.1~~GHVH01001374.1.p1  ORF type:complete len:301 (+),score=38.79 GHVH01001374.1:72-974(+)
MASIDRMGEILEAKKVLDAASAADGEILPVEEDITTALKSIDEMKLDITKSILASTKVGVSINRLRLTAPGSGVPGLTEDHKKECAKLLLFLKKQAVSDIKKAKMKPIGSLARLPMFTYCGPDQPNAKRMRTISTLLQAYEYGLPTAEEREEYDVVSLGKLLYDVEKAIHAHFYGVCKGDSAGYIDLLKALKSNICDRKNPDFRKQIYVGAITPEQIPLLNSSDMASQEKKMARDGYRKDALEACQSDWEIRHVKREEGQFPCGKCKSKKTTYFQMQTRSSDEPMTTYVTCNNCSNRWKF